MCAVRPSRRRTSASQCCGGAAGSTSGVPATSGPLTREIYRVAGAAHPGAAGVPATAWSVALERIGPMARRTTKQDLPDDFEEHILDTDIKQEMESSFLEYAYSVIYS